MTDTTILTIAPYLFLEIMLYPLVWVLPLLLGWWLIIRD